MRDNAMREWLSGGAPPCQGGGRGFDPRLALSDRRNSVSDNRDHREVISATMREWLSGGAPPCQGGGRGFDPRLALSDRRDSVIDNRNHREVISTDMREWLSGGAPPCQGGGRGFDPRLALFLTGTQMRTGYFYAVLRIFRQNAKIECRSSHGAVKKFLM